MARYIDADALMEMLNKKAQTDLEMGLYNHGTLTQSFIRFVERQPTADVAPRAEVAREIFEEIEKIINKNYESALNNEEDEELGAATDYMSYISYDLEELKKKYTEAETPRGEV